MKPTHQIRRDTTWAVSTEDTMQTIVQNGYDSADVPRLEQIRVTSRQMPCAAIQTRVTAPASRVVAVSEPNNITRRRLLAVRRTGVRLAVGATAMLALVLLLARWRS